VERCWRWIMTSWRWAAALLAWTTEQLTWRMEQQSWRMQQQSWRMKQQSCQQHSWRQHSRRQLSQRQLSQQPSQQPRSRQQGSRQQGSRQQGSRQQPRQIQHQSSSWRASPQQLLQAPRLPQRASCPPGCWRLTHAPIAASRCLARQRSRCCSSSRARAPLWRRPGRCCSSPSRLCCRPSPTLWPWAGAWRCRWAAWSVVVPLAASYPALATHPAGRCLALGQTVPPAAAANAPRLPPRTGSLCPPMHALASANACHQPLSQLQVEGLGKALLPLRQLPLRLYLDQGLRLVALADEVLAAPLQQLASERPEAAVQRLRLSARQALARMDLRVRFAGGPWCWPGSCAAAAAGGSGALAGPGSSCLPARPPACLLATCRPAAEWRGTERCCWVLHRCASPAWTPGWASSTWRAWSRAGGRGSSRRTCTCCTCSACRSPTGPAAGLAPRSGAQQQQQCLPGAAVSPV
jgi:hypothetical protein